jgi:hypothetical protein
LSHAQFPLRRHSNLPSIIDEAGVPQLLACGEQTLRAEKPAQVAGFTSEWWPASNRNPGRLQIGISGRIESEFAAIVAKFLNSGQVSLFEGPKNLIHIGQPVEISGWESTMAMLSKLLGE